MYQTANYLFVLFVRSRIIIQMSRKSPPLYRFEEFASDELTITAMNPGL